MCNVLDKIKRAAPLLLDPQALRAMTAWPVFSIASYTMVTSLFKQGIHPRTIIDVGANAGQFSVAALNIFNKVSVHAFEPVDSCMAKLSANTSSHADVHLYKVALSDNCGTAAFYLNSYDQAGSLLRLSDIHRSEFSAVMEKESIAIDVSTLDHFFSTSKLLAPVLLKIDVQGAEKQVLEGGRETLKKVDFVLLETSFTPMYVGEPLFAEMLEYMTALSYHFMRPLNFLKSPKSGVIVQMDVLFENTGAPSHHL